jgi:hypothetical protein
VTHLRSLAVAAACLAGAAVAQAQAPDQEELKRRLDQKLDAGFLKNAAWILDYDEAKAAAKKSGKRIFAYFTRSYAN